MNRTPPPRSPSYVVDREAELADGTVAKVECGEMFDLPVHSMRRIADAVGAAGPLGHRRDHGRAVTGRRRAEEQAPPDDHTEPPGMTELSPR
jgi:hypothetical protein